MKYNVSTEFDLQDFYLLKVKADRLEKQFEKANTSIKELEEAEPEKSSGSSIVLEPNVSLIATVMAFGTPGTPTYSFTVAGTNNPTITRKTTAYPSNAEPISMFHIIWDGLHGQIDWNDCYWLIERNEQPGDITLTFPTEYGYKISINYNI